MTPSNLERLRREASAKITWGETTPRVRAFLVTGGLSTAEADQWIRELKAERRAGIRRIGWKRLTGGLLLLAIFWILWAPDRFPTQAAALLLLQGLAGLYFTIDGAVKFLFPGVWGGSVGEMDSGPPD